MSSIVDDLPPALQNGSTHLHGQHPLRASDRINSIDVLRGVAVLGILFINIWVFALPQLAHIDSAPKGGNGQLNLASWLICEILVEGKMRALMSLLFGTGVILLTSRIESSGGSAGVTDIYYRRNIWLLVFGVSQSYLLIWVADFIYVYALVGLLLFPFRKMRAEGLIVVGFLALAVLVPGRVELESPNDVSRESSAQKKSLENERAELAASKPTDERQQTGLWILPPTDTPISETIKLQRSDYWTVFKNSNEDLVWFQARGFYTRYLWDVAGMVFIGMGLAKLGLFQRGQPTVVCGLLMAFGYGVGLPLTIDLVSGFHEPHAHVAYDVARLGVSLGHVGLVLFICNAGIWQRLTGSLAATGRMALSNYIAQTVVCTLMFNGYGLGLYGKLERWHTFLLAVAIGVVQMVVCTFWLRVFSFGPMEWLWRSLTYLKRQPIFASQNFATEASLSAELSTTTKDIDGESDE